MAMPSISWTTKATTAMMTTAMAILMTRRLIFSEMGLDSSTEEAREAMRPYSVWSPVAVTTKRPVPVKTKAPEKTILRCS